MWMCPKGSGTSRKYFTSRPRTSRRSAEVPSSLARSQIDATTVSPPIIVTPPPSRNPGGSMDPTIGTPSRRNARASMCWSPHRPFKCGDISTAPEPKTTARSRV